MNFSYEGVGYMALTIPNKDAAAGKLCKIGLDGRCETCASGDHFMGLVEEADAYRAAVQIEGFVSVKYTGEEPLIGFSKLSSNGSGGVKLDRTAGREYLVIDTDSVNAIVTFKL